MEQKSELVEGWCESGLTRAEYCRREGLGYGRFLAWIAQWADRAEEKASVPEFVEVRAAGGALEGNPDQPAIELVAPNGWRVRLGSDFESGALQRVLELLGRC